MVVLFISMVINYSQIISHFLSLPLVSLLNLIPNFSIVPSLFLLDSLILVNLLLSFNKDPMSLQLLSLLLLPINEILSSMPLCDSFTINLSLTSLPSLLRLRISLEILSLHLMDPSIQPFHPHLLITLSSSLFLMIVEIGSILFKSEMILYPTLNSHLLHSLSHNSNCMVETHNLNNGHF